MPLIGANKKARAFDPKEFLATISGGRKIILIAKNQTVYAQGEASDAVFYIQKGKVKLSVVAESGKEATLGILNPGVSSARVALRDYLSAWVLRLR